VRPPLPEPGCLAEDITQVFVFIYLFITASVRRDRARKKPFALLESPPSTRLSHRINHLKPMTMTTIAVTPITTHIGAEVSGVDLAQPLSTENFHAIHAAWMQHQVLVFPGQQLTDPQLEAFSARFGLLDRKPGYSDDVMDTTTSDYVCVISNVRIDGKAIGDLGDGEAVWHTDMSYNPLPPLGALLYALEIPPAGGETGFANMYMAYDTLPAALKARVETLQCKHDATRNSAGLLRRGMPDVTDPTHSPGTLHPMVRTHPVTSKPCLYLGRRRHAYVMGLPLAESEQLLDDIWAHAAKPEFSWHHTWRVGDVLMWDNRCVMHRRNPFDPAARRVMHRTQVIGDKPFYRSAAANAAVHAAAHT
jgi:taurine dioxygenase